MILFLRALSYQTKVTGSDDDSSLKYHATPEKNTTHMINYMLFCWNLNGLLSKKVHDDIVVEVCVELC